MSKRAVLITILLLVLTLLVMTTVLYAKIPALWIEDLTDELPRKSAYPTRSLTQIQRIVIHHSAWPNGSPWDYATLHIEERGWPGIGYHFVIQDDGTVYQTNALTSISYHVQNHNTPSIGICLTGNFETHGPSKAQEKSLKRLIEHLRAQMPNELAIKAHRDFKATSCPGKMTNISQY